MSPETVLRPLFEKAKAVDEFEFACCLMRIRGLEGPGWNPWLESRTLIQQTASFLQAAIAEDFQLRLLLFLYCHVTEMDDLYDFVFNLLRVSLGERCRIMPLAGFRGTPKKKRLRPHEKISQIVESSKEASFPDVGRVFEEMFVRNVRNAFYHSDYVLYKDSFNIDKGDGIVIEGIQTRRIPLKWLIPKLELGVNLILANIDLSIEYIQSYSEEKTVPARMGSGGSIVNAVLMVEKGRGLVGFRSGEREPIND